MNCQSFEAVVNDIVREQMIDVRVRSEALEHSSECGLCEQRLADERALSESLLSLAAAFDSAAAPARLEARLLAAFDQRLVVTSQSSSNSRSRYWIGAVAAVLLIAFGISVARWLRTGAVPSQSSALLASSEKPVAPGRPAPVPLTGGTKGTLPPDVPQMLAPVSRHRHRPGSTVKAPAVDTTNNEIATEFIPVTYGGAANLSEGGRMFRVQMPRSAMATFGLPVNMDRANEIVKADVLVGVDGLAHAIRFVR